MSDDQFVADRAVVVLGADKQTDKCGQQDSDHCDIRKKSAVKGNRYVISLLIVKFGDPEIPAEQEHKDHKTPETFASLQA